MTTTEVDALTTARELVDTAKRAIDDAVAHGTEVTEGGRGIDDHQVHTERVAYLATQVRAARELVAYAERLREYGRADEVASEAAIIYAAEAAHAVRSAVDVAPGDFGIGEAAEALDSAATRAAIRAGLDEARVRALGRIAIAANGVNNAELEDETAALTRDAARDFARNEVAPIAQQIHREDLLVPDDLLHLVPRGDVLEAPQHVTGPTADRIGGHAPPFRAARASPARKLRVSGVPGRRAGVQPAQALGIPLVAQPRRHGLHRRLPKGDFRRDHHAAHHSR